MHQGCTETLDPANFPQGKLPGVPEYTSVYYNMSDGDDAPRGPWNQGPH
ncbi:hypothetical protein PCAR4_350179 [Paraburkholderia caribensis]|nr:hypothetical protein PCAR4_350179 [Paraburkholderia caribensis]